MTVNNFKTSAYGRKFIESFEGLFLHTYDDGTGVPARSSSMGYSK